MGPMKVSVQVELQPRPFLTSTLDEGEQAPSQLGPFTRGTYWMESWWAPGLG